MTEVLAPLREKERELDLALVEARAAADRRLEAARVEAQLLRETARREVAAELAARRAAADRALDERRGERRAEAAAAVAALRVAAAPRRQAAVAHVVEVVLGGLTAGEGGAP